MSKYSYILLWCTFSALIVGVTGSGNLPSLWPLANRGVKTTAAITLVELNNHNSVHYKFSVGRLSFTGAQQGYSDARNGFPGKLIDIYYLPEDPHVSIADSPKPELANELAFVLSAGLLFPTLLVFGLFRQQRKRERGA